MHSAIFAVIAASPIATAVASLAPHAVATGVPHATATLSPEMQAQLLNYASQAPKSALAMHFPWLARTFAGAFIFSALLMIVLLAVQTTKQEGLGSSIGSSASTYRRRPGREQQLAGLTTFAAVLFVISATLVSLCGF